MQTKTVVGNGLVAALYVIISFIIQPIAFGQFQFRVPEVFNHLIVFNKKYFFGIVIGVFLANLFFSPTMAYDLIYGVGQSIISLAITILTSRFIKEIWARMLVNIVVFTVTMFLIALELHIAIGLPFAATWLVTAIEEFTVMAVGAPLIYLINKQVHFEKMI